MEEPRFTVCRADFLLPLCPPDRARRIRDGYVLAEGGTIREVGPYTPDVGRRLAAGYGSALRVLGAGLLRGECPSNSPVAIPRLSGVLLPAFVKAHGHDHEQPIIGIAKDEPLTSWLDHAVNPFTGFINTEHDRLSTELGCSPQLAAYRMARLCDIH